MGAGANQRFTETQNHYLTPPSTAGEVEIVFADYDPHDTGAPGSSLTDSPASGGSPQATDQDQDYTDSYER